MGEVICVPLFSTTGLLVLISGDIVVEPLIDRETLTFVVHSAYSI